MDLPIHRCEHIEIVDAISRRPWQTISAMYMPGHATAQGAASIIQRDLRDGAEDILANRAKRDGHREQHGRDTGAHDIGDPPLRVPQPEYAIGCRPQSPADTDP